MQVYKTFFKVAKKYKTGIIMYTVIVVFMLMVLSNTTSSGNQKVVQKKYSIVVVDNDNSEVSKKLYDHLDKVHNIHKGDYTDEQIRILLYNMAISSYIEIPEGFGEKFLEDGSITVKSTYDDAVPRGMFVNMQIDEYLNSIKNYMSIDYSLDEAAEKAEESLKDDFVSIQQKDTPEAESSYVAFIFLPYGIVSILFSGILPVIMSFNEKEKKNRTAVSATKMTTRNIAIILASATLALVVITLLIGMATASDVSYLFTKPWWYAVLNVVVYTFTITMLMTMIATLPIIGTGKEATNTVSFVTVIIGLTFAFLGGTFVGLDILGEGVAKIGRFTPNYWYSTASKKIWYDNAGLSDIIGCFGVQILMGITCLAIALAFTRLYGEKSE